MGKNINIYKKKAPFCCIINLAEIHSWRCFSITLQQITNFAKNKNKFLQAYEEFNVNNLLRKSNIKKRCGYNVSKIFRLLLSLVFHNKNLYEYINSEKAETCVSKNTYYRFLSNMTYRWWYLLSRLAIFVIFFPQTLTWEGRVSCLVLDDTVFSRNRSRKVEYLSRIFDHANHRYLRGFSMVASAGQILSVLFPLISLF